MVSAGSVLVALLDLFALLALLLLDFLRFIFVLPYEIVKVAQGRVD